MAGLGIKLYTDEMITDRLAPALRQQGYDVESCPEAGLANQRLSDPDQLSYAAQAGRALLTFNAKDFVLLDAAWKAAGRRHAGIILAPQIDDFGHLLRCVRRHLDTYALAVQDDVVLWLDTATPC